MGNEWRELIELWAAEAAAIAPVVGVIVQLSKTMITETKWYPRIGVIAGILLSFGSNLVLGTLIWPAGYIGAFIVGMLASAIAMGVYSAISNQLEGPESDKAKRAEEVERLRR